MSELEEQLKVIRELVKEDPDNSELLAVVKQLEEAVDMVRRQASPSQASARQPSPRILRPAGHTRPENPMIGKTCEVPHDGGWLTARIISVNGENVRVQFLAQAVTNEYPLANVKVLQPIDPRLCTSGAKLQAIWPKDGHWYDCEIASVKPDGYLVVFEGYKDKVEVKAEHLRKRQIVKSTEPREEYVTPAGYRIPEALKITEKDSDKLKEEKKRKIHHIKQQQRLEKQDEEATERQNAWKSFNKKVRR
jgi:survival of motor neuron-related-splicing factor 30